MKPNIPPSPSDDDAVYDALVRVALEIAGERAEALRKIKAELEAGNDQEALRLMRRYVAIEEQPATKRPKRKRKRE